MTSAYIKGFTVCFVGGNVFNLIASGTTDLLEHFIISIGWPITLPLIAIAKHPNTKFEYGTRVGICCLWYYLLRF